MGKISIFIPAYNAQRHIKSVIDRIPSKLWSDIESVWVINDGSSDNTPIIIESLCERIPKVKLVNLGRNYGYGTAVKKGIDLCKQDHCDIAVCLHADGQYPPELMPEIINIMLDAKYDIIQGSRIASGTAISGGMPLYKYLANRSLTFLENLAFHLKMTDYHSGYLFYSRKAQEIIPFKELSKSFDFDLEVIACAKAAGLLIGESPIPTRYADETSHLNPLDYGLRVLGVLFKYLTGRYKRLLLNKSLAEAI